MDDAGSPCTASNSKTQQFTNEKRPASVAKSTDVSTGVPQSLLLTDVALRVRWTVCWQNTVRTSRRWQAGLAGHRRMACACFIVVHIGVTVQAGCNPCLTEAFWEA